MARFPDEPEEMLAAGTEGVQPTSTGYDLGGDGTAAILGMLQRCSPDLSVANVDKGTGSPAPA